MPFLERHKANDEELVNVLKHQMALLTAAPERYVPQVSSCS